MDLRRLGPEDGNGVVVVKPGSIVTFTIVDGTEKAERLGFPPGTVLYTVEFPDGSDALIPESACALLPDTETLL
jgi:hypothetical protein